MLGTFTGLIQSGTDKVVLKVDDWAGAIVTLVGTFATLSSVFEASLDSKDGTNGTWFPIPVMRSNGAASYETGFSSLTNTPTYYWQINLDGWVWFRVRATGLTSGSALCAISPLTTVAPFPVATGSNAHDAPASGYPVRVATRAAFGMPSAVSAANDVCELTCTAQGALVVSPHVTPQSRLKMRSGLTTTGDVVVFAAAGAGLYNNVSDVQVTNLGASALDLILKDGSTEIFRLTLPVNIPVCFSLQSPMRGSANTAINATLSVAGTVNVNVQGFISV